MLTKNQNYTKFTGELADVIEALRKRKSKVGFAESCTGGRLSASWAEVPGVSDVFWGSVVSYSNSVKTEVLGVEESTLRDHGAVSIEVARQMARGLQKSLKVDWAVSVTGIAGPSGGSTVKPVGTVCFGIIGPGFEETCTQHFSGSRVEVQDSAVEFATHWLLKSVLKK